MSRYSSLSAKLELVFGSLDEPKEMATTPVLSGLKAEIFSILRLSDAPLTTLGVTNRVNDALNLAGTRRFTWQNVKETLEDMESDHLILCNIEDRRLRNTFCQWWVEGEAEASYTEFTEEDAHKVWDSLSGAERMKLYFLINRTEHFTVRDAQNWWNCTQRHTARVLDKFLRLGVIDRKGKGYAFIYTVNPNKVLWKVVKAVYQC